jgi:uncharacterized ferredoxin-like protein
MKPETDAVGIVAGLMALSARTAPKAKGTDFITVTVVKGKKLGELAREMERIGEARQIGFFLRDAKNIAASDACVIVGVQGHSPAGINCGGCGFAGCSEFGEALGSKSPADTPFTGPNCVLRMADIGVAVGSAVKTAAIHNLDNRVMYSVGVSALSLGWCGDCSVAYGIPLKASGKNIYFDRH